jgi:hypothetical protein
VLLEVKRQLQVGAAQLGVRARESLGMAPERQAQAKLAALWVLEAPGLLLAKEEL